MSNEITTPYDRVLIDPNEPLILPDGTAITGRLESFLYALCCLDYDNLPTPLSRIEEFANALITGEIPNIEPQSRSEQFFLAILDGNIDNLPEPQSRSEVLLSKLAVGDFDLTNVDPIQSRYELLLAYLIKNGGVGNLDYVLYEFYQATQTLYNTQEKPVKSAILKGQTLVNLCPNKVINYTATSDWDGFNALCQNSRTQESWRTLQDLKPSTKYFVSCYVETFNVGEGQYYLLNNANNSTVFAESLEIRATGLHKWVITSKSNFTEEVYVALRGQNKNARGTIKIRDIMIIEYQEGMENWDIPYFEGMKSVQMPVLTTVGKNLFDINSMSNINNWDTVVSNEIPYCSYKINLKPNTTYTFSQKQFVNTENVYASFGLKKGGFEYLLAITHPTAQYPTTFTLTTDDRGLIYVKLYKADTTLETFISKLSNNQLQLEESSTATLYEPFKSNILTANEEVELRGVGNVQDELNLLTGKVTQQIGEIVLNGSEYWAYSGDHVSNEEYVVYNTKITTPINSLNIGIADKLHYDKEAVSQTVFSKECVYLNSAFQVCYVRIKRERGDIVNYLNSNPITIQYQLATESIKTVDLSVIDQDGNVLPKIKTFNDTTHVTVSSDGILPKVEMEVATYNEEDIANANVMTASMDEIYSVQNELDSTNSIQSEEIDSTMIASTEIYENIL